MTKERKGWVVVIPDQMFAEEYIAIAYCLSLQHADAIKAMVGPDARVVYWVDALDGWRNLDEMLRPVVGE